MKAYTGIVQDLGKEADKLKKADPANAKEIANKQVCLNDKNTLIMIGIQLVRCDERPK